MLALYGLFMIGIRYMLREDSVSDSLSSPGFYVSILGTFAVIVFVYWVMTDKRSSRED